jgi:RNA polymerase sigma-70 factor (ECF subfamily)
MTAPGPEATAAERFEALWTAHYADLRSYALRRVRDQGAASDIAAETFLVAWRRFDDASNPSLVWLFAIARKLVANHHRRETQRRALHLKLISTRTDASPQLDVESSGEVARAFNSLSGRDREALCLVAWEGLRPREAAVVQGVSPATFSVRLHRAKERFRKRLEAAGQSELDGLTDSRSGSISTARESEATSR